MQGHQIVQVKRKDQFDLKSLFRDFPGDPEIKIACFHCRKAEGSISSPGKDHIYNHHHQRKNNRSGPL